MKKVEFGSENAHIVKIATSEPVEPTATSTSFDLSKLLQILPKLNLSQIFGNKSETLSSSPPTLSPDMEFVPTADLMRTQNADLARHTLETHQNTVKKLYDAG